MIFTHWWRVMGEWWIGFEADRMRFGHWCRRGLSLVHETPCGSGERKRRGLALVQCPGKSGKVRTGADRGARRSRSSGGQPCQPDVSTAMQCNAPTPLSIAVFYTLQSAHWTVPLHCTEDRTVEHPHVYCTTLEHTSLCWFTGELRQQFHCCLCGENFTTSADSNLRTGLRVFFPNSQHFQQ